MRTNIKKIFFILNIFILVVLSLFFCGKALAEEKPSFNTSKTKMQMFAIDLNFSNFDKSAENIIKQVMFLVNSLFFIFMIYAGILWLSSSGEEAKITKAKTIIIWCAIGMVVTLSAYSITAFVLSKL